MSHFTEYLDCKDAYLKGQNTSGVYTIKPDNQAAFQVYCDMDTDGGGWTVFQRRMDGSVDFYRNWADYEQGFGKLSGEHWLGLRKIHRLTTYAFQELWVTLGDFEGNTRYAHYETFSVTGTSDNYRLLVFGYSGTAGDSLKLHSGYPFSTKDQDNDAHSVNCAINHKAGWWYEKCHRSNLNGLYHGGNHESYADGVNWYHWREYHYSLKLTEMKLRRKW